MKLSEKASPSTHDVIWRKGASCERVFGVQMSMDLGTMPVDERLPSKPAQLQGAGGVRQLSEIIHCRHE